MKIVDKREKIPGTVRLETLAVGDGFLFQLQENPYIVVESRNLSLQPEDNIDPLLMVLDLKENVLYRSIVSELVYPILLNTSFRYHDDKQ